METAAILWPLGGMLASVAYLAGIALPDYREHAPTAGLLADLLHFGPRAIMVFLLWPLVMAVFVSVWLSERGRA